MPIRGTRRVVLAVLACELIPVPLVDTVVQNEIRRAWVRSLRVEDPDVLALAIQPLVPWKRMALWPLKALLEKVFPPFALWGAWTAARDTWQLGERLARGPAQEETPGLAVLPS